MPAEWGEGGEPLWRAERSGIAAILNAARFWPVRVKPARDGSWRDVTPGRIQFLRNMSFSLPARGKPRDFLVIRPVFGRARRPHDDKFSAEAFDNARQIIALVRSHVPKSAMRTIVVAHARPFVRPVGTTVGAFVAIAKPRQFSLPLALCDRNSADGKVLILRSQAIVPARDKVQVAVIPEHLKLLTDFLLHVFVVGIELTQSEIGRAHV